MKYHFEQIAGDTLDQKITVPDYPSTDGWTLKYRLDPRFSSPTQAPISLTAVSNGDGTYQLQAGPTDTATWTPGAYSWWRWVEKTGARQTLSSSKQQGEVLVLQDPATAAQPYDSRSFAKKMLEQYEAALLALNGSTVKSYTVGSRQLTYDDRNMIIQEISRLRWVVENEENKADMAAGLPNRRQIRAFLGRQ